MDFIPAKESALFTTIFRPYVKLLFRRRFKHIWIHHDYQPTSHSRTVYFLNHTSWWDGLIPFLLNEYRFNQKGRAMMELKQMKKYPFFKWLGAFSIQPDDRNHTLASLKYAIKSMQRENASLFIYPQGEIKPVTLNVDFKPGIGWLYKQLPDVEFVPIGIHMHAIRHRKSEVHIWIGHSVETNLSPQSIDITKICERRMNDVLQNLISTAGVDDYPYQNFFA